mgnify:CR=1 FL=1
MTLKEYMKEWGIKEEKEAIIEMTIDFITGRDKEIRQSDYLTACWDYGFDDDEIEAIAKLRIED